MTSLDKDILNPYELIYMLDDYTKQHSFRVKKLAMDFGKRLGLTTGEVLNLGTAALLHDLGKVTIDRKLLTRKAPFSLSESEQWMLHPELGARIWCKSGGSRKVSEIILTHHERYDGSGYPLGLSKENIPLGSRIVAIANAYDLLRNPRNVFDTFSHEEAVKILYQHRTKRFDPNLLDYIFSDFEKRAMKKWLFTTMAA